MILLWLIRPRKKGGKNMKKKISIMVISAAMLLISLVPTQGLAKSNETKKKNKNGEIVHIVEKNESVSDIAKEYGVSLKDLKKKNNIKNNDVDPGDTIVLPKTFTSKEKDLIARLVHAEAKGEPYKGKVAVATVVLNRVESDKFPNTVSGVIHAKGQFTPVSNGSIKKSASKEAKKAVNEAIAIHEQNIDATFFYNPKKTKDRWIKSLKVVAKIGNHNFAIS